MNPLLLERLLLHLQFPRVVAWRDPGVSERLLARVQSTRSSVPPTKPKASVNGVALEVAQANSQAENQANDVAVPNQEATPEDVLADAVAQYESATTEQHTRPVGETKQGTTEQQNFLNQLLKNTKNDTKQNAETITKKDAEKNTEKNAIGNLKQPNQNKPENILSNNEANTTQTQAVVSPKGNSTRAAETKTPTFKDPYPDDTPSSNPSPKDAQASETTGGFENAAPPQTTQAKPTKTTIQTGQAPQLNKVVKQSNTSPKTQGPEQTALEEGVVPVPVENWPAVEGSNNVVAQTPDMAHNNKQNPTRSNEDLQTQPTNHLQPSSTNPNDQTTNSAASVLGTPPNVVVSENTNAEILGAKPGSPKATGVLLNPALVVQELNAAMPSDAGVRPDVLGEPHAPDKTPSQLEPSHALALLQDQTQPTTDATHPLGLSDLAALQVKAAQHNPAPVLTATPQGASEPTREPSSVAQPPSERSQNPTPDANTNLVPGSPGVASQPMQANSPAPKTPANPTPNLEAAVQPAQANTPPSEKPDDAIQNPPASNVLPQGVSASAVEIYNPPSARVPTKRPPKQQPSKNAAQRLFEDLPDTAPQDWLAKLQSAGFVAQEASVADFSVAQTKPSKTQDTNPENPSAPQLFARPEKNVPSENTKTTQASTVQDLMGQNQVTQNLAAENLPIESLPAKNLRAEHAAQDAAAQNPQTKNTNAMPRQRLDAINLPILKRPAKAETNVQAQTAPAVPEVNAEFLAQDRERAAIQNASGPNQKTNSGTLSKAPPFADLGVEANTNQTNDNPPLEPSADTAHNVVATEVYNPPNRRVATNPKAKSERAKNSAERLFEDLPDTAPQDWFAKLQSAGFVDTNTPALRQGPNATTGQNLFDSSGKNPGVPNVSTANTPPQAVPARIVQRSETTPRPFANPTPHPAVSNSAMSNSIGPSQTVQLSEQARRLLQPIVGLDPHTVRIERDTRSDALTRAANADALTLGDVVVLSPGLASETPAMLGVVAHELTHVAKARGARFVPAMHSNPNGDEESLALYAESQARTLAQSLQQSNAAQAAPWQVNNTLASKAGQAQPDAVRFVPSQTNLVSPTMPTVMPSTPSSALQTLNALYAPQPSSAPGRAAIQAAASDRSVPVTAPAATPAPNATLPTRASETPKDSAGTRETKPNLDAIAQEVYHIIKRRLAAERRRS